MSFTNYKNKGPSKRRRAPNTLLHMGNFHLFYSIIFCSIPIGTEATKTTFLAFQISFCSTVVCVCVLDKLVGGPDKQKSNFGTIAKQVLLFY